MTINVGGRCRPEELRDLSPYIWAMCTTVQYQDKTFLTGNDNTRMPLRSDHPKAAKYMVRVRKAPVVPQLLCDPPARPLSDEAITDEHHNYAAFVLGVLLADWDWRERLARVQGDVYAALLAWEAEPVQDGVQGIPYKIARTVQRNMDEVANAKRRMRESAQRFREARAQAGVVAYDSDLDEAAYETDEEDFNDQSGLAPAGVDDNEANASVEALLNHDPM